MCTVAQGPVTILTRVGAVLLTAGMVFSLVALLPRESSSADPAWWWLSITAVGAGLGIVLAGLVRRAILRSRQQRRALRAETG
jgi:uncharacterized membrane protein